MLLAFTTFWPVLHVGFLWDDHVMIESNPWMQSWSAAAIRHDFSGDVFDGRGDAYYRPAQTLANRLDYSLWGLRPFGYHLTNLGVHALNAVLVGELVLALGFLPLTALLVASFYAVHPIIVEQLLIIAGRAELFAFLFSLLALLALLRKGMAWLVAAATCTAAALLFKESSVVLPVLGALVLFQAGVSRREYQKLIPMALTVIFYLALRIWVMKSPLENLSTGLSARFVIQALPNILARYVRLLVIPWNLHSHRMVPRLSHLWPLLFIGLTTLLVFAWRKKNTLWLFCAGWFIVTMLPKTPPMINGNFTLDHWVYPAALGIFLPMALVFTVCWTTGKRDWHRRVGYLLFPLLIGWALVSRLNIALRDTDEKMYRWALHFTSSHPIRANLAVLLISEHRPTEAVPLLEDVVAVYPEDYSSRHALAVAYWQLGHRWLAVKMLNEILKSNPSFKPAAQSLAHIEHESRQPSISK